MILAWHYANWSHRLLKDASAVVSTIEHVRVAATDPDIPVSAVSFDKKGRWHYTIPSGVSQVRLKVRVVDPTLSSGPPLASVEQTFSVSPLAPSSAGLYGRLHPRVVNTKAVSAGVIDAELDFTFLDVTDLARGLQSLCEVRLPNPTTTAAMLKDFYGGAHYGASTRIYEYTGGRPATWVVVLPPAVRAPRVVDDNRAPISVCIFYRPVDNGYKDIFDVQLHPIFRYIAEGQDPISRFFWLREDAKFFWALGKSPNYGFNFAPPCGYERQVSAQKQVMLACPVPHGDDFGDAVTKVAPLADQLVRAAHARMIDTDGIEPKAPVRRNRIALAGFSYGGGVALEALRLNGPSVSEIYMFDPAHFNDRHVRYLARWLAADTQRKARLVRGEHWPSTEPLARVLGQKPRAAKSRTWSEPPSEDYYFLDTLYCGSLIPPFFAGPRFVSQVGHPASEPLLTLARLNTDLDLEAITVGDPKQMSPRAFNLVAAAVPAAPLPIANVNRYELTLLILRRPAMLPVDSAKSWAALRAIILVDLHLRHQWTAFGGFDVKEKLGDFAALNGNRQPDFSGYLQAAIEDSFL